ncbi:hypothetical protein Tco_1572621 [Tanacetum coccineum]
MLTKEEALEMVTDLDDKEIKEAMFDIGENRAPGPDGFTSAFFKQSWHIIGKDVTQAIKEFFRTGKMLGEINATLITLIPKIPHPNKGLKALLVLAAILVMPDLLVSIGGTTGSQCEQEFYLVHSEAYYKSLLVYGMGSLDLR